MGDMADYYNELQEEGGRYFPPGDPYRVRVAQKPPSTGTCDKCGARFVWTVADGKWQPTGRDGRRHECSPINDFEDLTK